jgi:hypothetical protein
LWVVPMGGDFFSMSTANFYDDFTRREIQKLKMADSF